MSLKRKRGEESEGLEDAPPAKRQHANCEFCRDDGYVCSEHERVNLPGAAIPGFAAFDPETFDVKHWKEAWVFLSAVQRRALVEKRGLAIAQIENPDIRLMPEAMFKEFLTRTYATPESLVRAFLETPGFFIRAADVMRLLEVVDTSNYRFFHAIGPFVADKYAIPASAGIMYCYHGALGNLWAHASNSDPAVWIRECITASVKARHTVWADVGPVS